VRTKLAILLVLLTSAAAGAADKPGAAPAGHHHGAATLQVSLDGGALQVALEGPADNILGFEHAPRTDAQKATAAKAEQRLKEPDTLFTTPPAAGCKAEPARVEMKLPPAGSRDTHSEIETAWRWACANPAALAYLDVGLFKAFPRLKQLRAQVVTPRGQSSAVLKPGAARLKIGS
jgi:Protein of unknown function (DUF2796)